MTPHNPSIFVHRLMITRSGKPVYNEAFSSGLNVIYGKNGSGKTTIVRALMYSLGHDLSEWTPELLSCDAVIVEVSLNGDRATLKRNISNNTKTSMEIYWGGLENANSSEISQWQRFPYQTTSGKTGFTTRLFEALGIPQSMDESSNRITMHQILRMSYGDQSSPARALLGSEPFDSAIKREAIAHLLLGIYDGELFSARTELNNVERKISTCQSKLTSIQKVIGASKHRANLNEIDDELSLLQKDIANTDKEISEFKRQTISSLDSQDEKKMALSLADEKQELHTQSAQLMALKLEIADSKLFASELKHRLNCLTDSQKIEHISDNTPFAVCPCCSSDISRLERKSSSCQLCGTELKKTREFLNFQKLKSEISLQLMESEKLSTNRLNQLPKLESAVNELSQRVALKQRQYSDAATDISPEHQKVLQRMYRHIGYQERSIEALHQIRNLARLLQDTENEKIDLVAQQTKLKNRIQLLERSKEQRTIDVFEKISANAAQLLRGDLDRQKGFTKTKTVEVDFASNSILVDGAEIFSESSTVLLKNIVLLSVLATSNKDPKFRFPRFLVLDGIENGGMETVRCHNLQNLIMTLSDGLETQHQIIITTKSLSKPVRKSATIVGGPYSKDNRSLKID